LSKSTSITSLKQLAAEVTRKPPIININQFVQLISGAGPPSMETFDPIKNVIEAENTTRKVSLNLMSLEKSAKNCFKLYLINVAADRYLCCTPLSTGNIVN